MKGGRPDGHRVRLFDISVIDTRQNVLCAEGLCGAYGRDHLFSNRTSFSDVFQREPVQITQFKYQEKLMAQRKERDTDSIHLETNLFNRAPVMPMKGKIEVNARASRHDRAYAKM
jgi:hypothetical protein